MELALINDLKDRYKEVNDKKKLIKKWKKVMYYTSLYNFALDSFKLTDEVKTSYGWSFKLYPVNGLGLDKIDKAVKEIEDSLRCRFKYSLKDTGYAECHIVYN